MKKKIGLLTSGGDAPGMNACIRAVVRTAGCMGMEVIGIERGYLGLVNGYTRSLDMRSVSDIIHRGGTMLKTARCPEFKEKEGQLKALKTIRENELEGLIVIGGDGSFNGARVLSVDYNIPTIGIPGTIDNDLQYTDYTLGFDTACNTVLLNINNLRDTMTSHDRVSIVEVMGRNCGDIALYAGITSGAEIIIVPEVPITMEEIANRLMESKKAGKTSDIIVLAEGAGNAMELQAKITEMTGLNVRSTVLGHIQRGGTPTMMDRMLACKFGAHAVSLVYQGIGNRVVGIRNNTIVDYDIVEALNMKRPFDQKMYSLAAMLSK